MVKAIRNDEVNYAYTIDRRTVQKLLSKLECEGKILIVNEKIFLEEEQSYNGTFYTTIDCTNETFQAGIHPPEATGPRTNSHRAVRGSSGA